MHHQQKSTSHEEMILSGEEKTPPLQSVRNNTKEKEHDYNPNAWLNVVGTFFVFLNTWGLIMTFGLFQTYYQQSFLHSKSESEISWIGTITASLTFLGGWFTGPAFDKGFFRHLLLGGFFLLILGYMMLSLVDTYAEAFLAHGVCVGAGAAMVYVPSLAGLGITFKARRSIAIALASSGGGIGGIIYPAMFYHLVPEIGFHWVIRVIGFTILATSCITLVTILPRPPSSSNKLRRSIDWSALKSAPFVNYMLSGLFTLIGYYIPFVYLPQVGQSVNLSPKLAAYLPAIANAAAIFGRILSAFVADKYEPVYVLSFSQFIGAILLAAWIAVDSVLGLIIWTIFWGFVSGIMVAIAPAVIPTLTPSLNVVGSWNGMWFAACAVGILIGGPIGGTLIRGQQLWPMQVFSSLTLAIGGILCIVPMRYVYSRNKS